eukprot:SAG31_NODE_15661_length_744_cov_0.922481_1_plen_73_part_00
MPYWNALQGRGGAPEDLGSLVSGPVIFNPVTDNTSSPAAANNRGDLIGAFAAHLVDRHGLEEIETWRFEVWK